MPQHDANSNVIKARGRSVLAISTVDAPWDHDFIGKPLIQQDSYPCSASLLQVLALVNTNLSCQGYLCLSFALALVDPNLSFKD